MESSDESQAQSPANLRPSGHGYSIKTPSQKKRASLLRSQHQAQQILTPREVKRRNLASQKIIQPLGGTGEEVQDAEIRAQRLKYLRRKRREEKSRKLARITTIYPKEQGLLGRMASLSVEDKDSPPASKPDARLYELARTRAQVALDTVVEDVGHKERANLLALTLRKLLMNARNQSSRRRLKLSNNLLWERVTRYYGGRAVLNAAGFQLIREQNRENHEQRVVHGEPQIQYLDVMESMLKKVGRAECIFLLSNVCFELIAGALDAVNAFLSGSH